MSFLEQHPLLNHELQFAVDGELPITGVCDLIEVKPGCWRDLAASTALPGRSIRFRLRVPPDGQRIWTEWFRDDGERKPEQPR